MFEQNFNTIYSKDFKNKREDIFDVKDDLNQQKSSVEILAYQNNSTNKCKNYIRQDEKSQIISTQRTERKKENLPVYLRIHNKQKNLIYVFKILRNQ